MSDFTRVNASAMQTGIDDLQQAYTRFTEILESLRQDIGTNLSQWEGNAREAYTAKQAEWDKRADHMGQVVQKMHGALGQIHEGYGSNESKVASSWS